MRTRRPLDSSIIEVRRSSSLHFFFRGFNQRFNLLHLDTVIQRFEGVHPVAEQRLLDGIPGQLGVEEGLHPAYGL
jgi:hypothetical protein